MNADVAENIIVRTDMAVSLEVALASPRAMVVLNVPWSGYSARARRVFHEAIPHLKPLDITFLVADEDFEFVKYNIPTNIDIIEGQQNGKHVGLTW